MNTLHEFIIPQDIVSAIINDDFSGLSDEDMKATNDWRKENKIGHVMIPDNMETEFLPWNDILGWIGADCLTVKATINE